jgi:small subunit ribosomal protein S20
MPIIKRAIKKLKHDRKRTLEIRHSHALLQKMVKSMRKKPTQKSLTQVFSALDKAAKTHIIHKNKADRLKARLSKLLAKK